MLKSNSASAAQTVCHCTPQCSAVVAAASAATAAAVSSANTVHAAAASYKRMTPVLSLVLTRLLLLLLLQAVDWRALMASATTHYSKESKARMRRAIIDNTNKNKNSSSITLLVEPAADADAKHAAAVPEMHAAAVSTGLLDSYKQLQSMQKWRRPAAAAAVTVT
jgi:hypothetical protein